MTTDSTTSSEGNAKGVEVSDVEDDEESELHSEAGAVRGTRDGRQTGGRVGRGQIVDTDDCPQCPS